MPHRPCPLPAVSSRSSDTNRHGTRTGTSSSRSHRPPTRRAQHETTSDRRGERTRPLPAPPAGPDPTRTTGDRQATGSNTPRPDPPPSPHRPTQPRATGNRPPRRVRPLPNPRGLGTHPPQAPLTRSTTTTSESRAREVQTSTQSVNPPNHPHVDPAVRWTARTTWEVVRRRRNIRDGQTAT